jgi:hypothetical protein
MLNPDTTFFFPEAKAATEKDGGCRCEACRHYSSDFMYCRKRRCKRASGSRGCSDYKRKGRP